MASDALASKVVSELPLPELKRQITKQRSTLPVYFDTCSNCTIVPQKDAQELGLSVKAGTAATVAGVGAPQRTTGMTVLPSLVRAHMGDRVVDANIALKAQVMLGMRDKVIACASQFVTEFDGAALLMLDPETKQWGGTMPLPHGAKLALSVTSGGMTVLRDDSTLCQGGQVSVVLAIEKVCAELIRRESVGTGKTVKEILAGVASSQREQPVRKKEAPNAARLGQKGAHSERGQSENVWSCLRHETTEARSEESDSDEDPLYSPGGVSRESLNMDPEDALSDIVKSEMAAFMGNLESKFGDALASSSPGSGAALQEGELAQWLVQQAEEALARCAALVGQWSEATGGTEAGLEHSLLGVTPETAVKLQELEGQIVQARQAAVERAEQTEAERGERVALAFAAMKADDAAATAGLVLASAAKSVPAPEHDPDLAAVQLEAETSAHASADKILAATGLDACIAEFQRLVAQSARMAKEQTALAATMTSLGAELAAERSGVATPATPSSPRRRDAAVALGLRRSMRCCTHQTRSLLSRWQTEVLSQ